VTRRGRITRRARGRRRAARVVSARVGGEPNRRVDATRARVGFCAGRSAFRSRPPTLPAADPAEYAAALALVPCLAASRDGVRLGRGGGYYDRFLAHYKGAGLLLCPEALLLDKLPCDDWDARFAPENILTEKGILR